MKPTPRNDPVMKDLFDLVGNWREKHKIQGIQEHYYLAELLAGRLNVMVSLENIKSWSSDQEIVDENE